MPPSRMLTRPTQIGVIALAIVGVVGIGAAVAKQIHPKALAANNLFSLVGQLKGTTGSMLENTQALDTEVNRVQTQLAQLDTQEQILNQQATTGQALALQLQRQVQLTGQGVDLMRQILIREHATATITGRVANLTSNITAGLSQNIRDASNLTDALNLTANTSTALNGQMDSLLAELARSEQDFRFFGQVNHLLPTLTQPLLGGGSVSGVPSTSGTPLVGSGSSSSPSNSLPVVGGLMP